LFERIGALGRVTLGSGVVTRPMTRLVLRLFLLLTLLLTGGSAVAEPDNVRTGRTEMAAPSEAPPEATEATEEEPAEGPSDAPHLGARKIVRPVVAAGFNTYDAGWIQFSYHPSVRERVQPLIADADKIKQELEGRLGPGVLKGVRVDVARTPGEMETLAPVGAPYPSYASGVAYSALDLVLLTLAPRHANDANDIVQTFRHELAHIALYDALDGRPIPRWFNEGFAVLASGESSFERMGVLWTATVADTLLPLSDVERSFPADEDQASIAYAEAVDVVRFLLRREEQHRFRGLIDRLEKGHDLEAALKLSYGITLADLEHEWREDVAKRYTFWPVLFSGTLVWAITIGLFLWAWRRKQARARRKLARWEREEASEDALSRMRENARVHIVLARTSSSGATPLPPAGPEIEVPKVQHEGQWHTLH
jgi:hypothetical protein